MPASSTRKKTKSGNPAKATSAKSWKRNKGEEITLPSGNVALVKRPGPQALLAEGVMPDVLMPIVQQAIAKGKGMKPQDTSKLMQDQDNIVQMLDSMDKLLCMVVVEPAVHYHRKLVVPGKDGKIQGVDAVEEWVDIPEEERDADAYVYTDEVDLEDKMFIFQYAVGGTRDLERFRSEQQAGVGNLPDVSGHEDTAE
jgi:hypothetical protein